MAKIERFEDIEAWVKARGIARNVYTTCNQGKTNKEFIQFLYIAKGSGGEVRSQICIALDLGYIHQDVFDSLNLDLLFISIQLSGFIQYLQSSSLKGQKR